MVLVEKMREGAEARAAFPLEEGRIVVAGIDGTRRDLPRFSRHSAHPGCQRTGRLFRMGICARSGSLGADALALDERTRAHGRDRRSRGARCRPLGPNAGLGSARRSPVRAASTSASKRLLVAYAAGVNARLARIRDGRVAPPIALEGATLPVDLWKPSDSLAILKYYGWALADTVDVSLVLRDITAYLGSRAARPFFPLGGEESPSPFQGVLAKRQSAQSIRNQAYAWARAPAPGARCERSVGGKQRVGAGR